MFSFALITLALAPQAAAPAQAKPAIEIKTVKSIPLKALTLTPATTGSLVAMTLEDGSVRILDAATRETKKTFGPHPQPAYGLDWSEDAAWVVTGDETARIWLSDARTGEKKLEIRKHQRGIQNLSFNLPRTLLLSTGKDDVVKVWDPLTGKELNTFLGEGANFYSATFHPTDNTFAVGTIGAGARIYDAKVGGTPKAFLTSPDVMEVNDVAYNANGTRLLTAGRLGNTRLWDMKTMKGIGSFKGHTDWVTHARFSPNGTYVATSSTDGTVRIYNTYNFQTVAVLEGQSMMGAPVAWTADGKWLLTTGSDDWLQVHSVTPAQAPVVTKPAPAKKPVRRTTRRRR